MTMLVDPAAQSWTCWGCGSPHPDSPGMPDNCPKCGGIWVREIRPMTWEYDGLRGTYRWSRREGNGVLYAAFFALVVALDRSPAR
jgi:hypothetical protein